MSQYSHEVKILKYRVKEKTDLMRTASVLLTVQGCPAIGDKRLQQKSDHSEPESWDISAVAFEKSRHSEPVLTRKAWDDNVSTGKSKQGDVSHQNIFPLARKSWPCKFVISFPKSSPAPACLANLSKAVGRSDLARPAKVCPLNIKVGEFVAICCQKR